MFIPSTPEMCAAADNLAGLAMPNRTLRPVKQKKDKKKKGKKVGHSGLAVVTQIKNLAKPGTPAAVTASASEAVDAEAPTEGSAATGTEDTEEGSSKLPLILGGVAVLGLAATGIWYWKFRK